MLQPKSSLSSAVYAVNESLAMRHKMVMFSYGRKFRIEIILNDADKYWAYWRVIRVGFRKTTEK